MDRVRKVRYGKIQNYHTKERCCKMHRTEGYILVGLSFLKATSKVGGNKMTRL